MKKVKLEDIKITTKFASSVPNKLKIEECKKHLIEGKQFDRFIVVNNEGYLTDGYVLYLVLKEIGYKEEFYVKKCIKDKKKFYENKDSNDFIDKEIKYVVGHHPGSNKKYVFAAYEKTPTPLYGIIDVFTKHGYSKLIVDDVIYNEVNMFPLTLNFV